jgi:parvulin-like peptidyl-prolyl isomerase
MRSISQGDVLQQVKLSSQFPAIVEAIASRQIVAQHAKAFDLQIGTAELQKAADSFRLKNNLVTVEQTVAWLKQHGLSLDDLEALMHHTVLSAKLAEHLFSGQVEPYFAERQLDYDQVVLYEVILQNGDLAIELFYAIQEQETTFAEVARHYIQDEKLRRRSGYRGLVKRADLKPELSAAVFAASAPQLLKPVSVGKNIHLVFVEEVIQPQLDEALRSQIMTELFSEWLKKQLAQQDWTTLLSAIAPPPST